MRKALALVLLMVIFVSLVAGMHGVEVTNANFFPEKPSHGVYIKSNGNIEPATAPIKKVGNTYTFTGDIINHPIVVEQDNIVIDGAGFTLKGNGSYTGIEMSYRGNVTISNIHIKSFYNGIFSYHSNHNTISGNIITESSGLGIYLLGASNCVISDNLVENNGDGVKCIGTTFHYPSYIVDNIVRYNDGVGIYNCTDNIFGGNVVENNGVNFGLLEPEPTSTPELTPTPEPTPTNSPNTTLQLAEQEAILGIAVTIAVVVISLCLLVYLIKRK